jgi:hypothetical protein
MTDNRSKTKLSDASPMNSHSKSTILIRKQKDDLKVANSARNSSKAKKGTFREAHKVVQSHAMPKSLFRASSTTNAIGTKEAKKKKVV